MPNFTHFIFDELDVNKDCRLTYELLPSYREDKASFAAFLGLVSVQYAAEKTDINTISSDVFEGHTLNLVKRRMTDRFQAVQPGTLLAIALMANIEVCFYYMIIDIDLRCT